VPSAADHVVAAIGYMATRGVIVAGEAFVTLVIRGRTMKLKQHHSLFGLLLSIIIISMAVAKLTPVSFERRGLHIQSGAILDRLPMPSFEELRSIRITELGTNVYVDFKLEWWDRLRDWNREVHLEGFKTFAFINDPAHLKELFANSVRSGFDSIELDELVSSKLLDRDTLRSTIAYARELRPGIEFTITECHVSALTAVNSWTSDLAGIRIASSDYNSLNTAEWVAQQTTPRIDLLGRSGLTRARAAAWIILIPDPEHDWACYRNLELWLSRIKTLNIDILLWTIDANGSWVHNWPKILSILSH